MHCVGAPDELELQRPPGTENPERHSASRTAEDPAHRLVEREPGGRRTVDRHDRVPGPHPRDARRPDERPAHEQASWRRQHEEADAAVAARVGPPGNAVFRRREIRRVAVVERAEQRGHRRLAEDLLGQLAVVERGELGPHLGDLGLVPRGMGDRAQREADPERHERRSCNSEDDRPPHDRPSLSDPPPER